MPIRRSALATAAVLALCALAASTGSAAGPAGSRAALSPASAARFFLAEVQAKLAGDWERAWRGLYPPHQRVAPRAVFVRCEQATPFAAPLESLHVVRVRAAAVRVPGSARPVPGVAVVAAVELRWFGPRDPIVFLHTFHLVPVDGRWTWLLSPERYRLYAGSGCSPARQVATRARVADTWPAPVNIGAGVNTAASESRPSLSRDGNQLLFGRTPGPEGMSDIYQSNR